MAVVIRLSFEAFHLHEELYIQRTSIRSFRPDRNERKAGLCSNSNTDRLTQAQDLSLDTEAAYHRLSITLHTRADPSTLERKSSLATQAPWSTRRTNSNSKSTPPPSNPPTSPFHHRPTPREPPSSKRPPPPNDEPNPIPRPTPQCLTRPPRSNGSGNATNADVPTPSG